MKNSFGSAEFAVPKSIFLKNFSIGVSENAVVAPAFRMPKQRNQRLSGDVSKRCIANDATQTKFLNLHGDMTGVRSALGGGEQVRVLSIFLYSLL